MPAHLPIEAIGGLWSALRHSLKERKMATCSTNVWWSSDSQMAQPYSVTAPGEYFNLSIARVTAITATPAAEPDPDHEFDVIQRLSDQWRKMKQEGQTI